MQHYPLCYVREFFHKNLRPFSENTNTGSTEPARKKEQEQDSFPQQETEREHGDCYLSVLMDNALTKQAAHFPKSIDCFQVRYYYMLLL